MREIDLKRWSAVTLLLCGMGQLLVTLLGGAKGPDGLTETLRFVLALGLAGACFAAAFTVAGFSCWRLRHARSAARRWGAALLALSLFVPLANGVHLFWWPSAERMVAAAQVGDAGVVRRCLRFGIDPDAKGMRTLGFGGRSPTPTALAAAAGAGHAPVIEILLEAGADPSVDGGAALAAAVNAGHASLVESLLVSPRLAPQVWPHLLWNGSGQGERRIEALRRMLSLGLPVLPEWHHADAMFLSDDRFAIAMARAATTPKSPVIELLNAIARGEGERSVALYAAVRHRLVASPSDAEEHTRYLATLASSASRVARSRPEAFLDPMALLMLAAKYGADPLVAQLLEDGVSPDPPDTRFDHPRSPLSYAAASGRVGSARLLVEAGADVSRVDGGYGTPLHGAAASGSTRLVELLLEAGADPDAAQNEVAATPPSHWAADAGHVDVVRALLARGARAEHAGWEGRTLATIATRRQDAALLSLLASSDE